LAGYGYAGVFAASLLGSLIPFVSGPYIPPIILAIMAGRLDPFPTALASALGAALAKAVLFKFFKGGRVLLGEESRKRIEPLERLVARHGWLAVVAAAATPLPDDIIFLLLGLPDSIAFKPSSPQLYPGHRATDELPADYDTLDPILYALFDKNLSVDEVVGLGADRRVVEAVVARFKGSIHKREMPPVGPRPVKA